MHYQSVIKEHHQMMDYLNRKDLKRLQETIETHVRTFQQRIVHYLTA